MSGTKYNPSVPMGDLVFAVDAANPKCEFISGSTNCKNIMTGGNVSGASGTPGSGSHSAAGANFPEYNASYVGAKTPVFDFAGGRGMNIDEDLGSSSGGLT